MYPPPPGESDIIGLEVAGTVDTLGPGVKRTWKPDDRVMALLCGGGYAEYVAVPEELLMPAPPNLTLFHAAAIPEVWLTAFQLLVFIGTATKFIYLFYSIFSIMKLKKIPFKFSFVLGTWQFPFCYSILSLFYFKYNFNNFNPNTVHYCITIL